MGFWRHRRWLLLGVQQFLVHKRMGVRRIHKDIRNPMVQLIAYLGVLVGFVQQKRWLLLDVQRHRSLQEGQLWQHDEGHMGNIHRHMGNRSNLDVARLRHQQISCRDSVRILHIRIHVRIRIHHIHNVRIHHNRNKHQLLQLVQHQQTAFHGSRSKLIQIQEQLLQAMKDVGS